MTMQAIIDQVQNIYIGFLGRPADMAGLQYWAQKLDSGEVNLASVVQAFADSVESQALYGTSASSALVDRVYENLLHRAPDAAGKAYWVDALDRGVISAAELVIQMLGGAQGEDLLLVQNTTAAANQFTNKVTDYSGEMSVVIGRTFLSQVSSDTEATNALLSDIASYINAAAAATKDPAQFEGLVDNGVLRDPSLVHQYAPAPVAPGTPGNGPGTPVVPGEGGDTGTPVVPDEGGDTGTPVVPDDGGDTGTPVVPDEGGDTGAPVVPDEGGDTGTPVVPDDGGDTGTPVVPDEGGDSGTPVVPDEDVPVEGDTPTEDVVLYGVQFKMVSNALVLDEATGAAYNGQTTPEIQSGPDDFIQLVGVQLNTGTSGADMGGNYLY